jgi:hypothetical protein
MARRILAARAPRARSHIGLHEIVVSRSLASQDRYTNASRASGELLGFFPIVRRRLSMR